MTYMLASVTCVSEALVAQRGGADVIDLKDPARGALGALSHETVSRVVAALDGGCVSSATVGDLPPDAGRVRAAVRDMAATGVDVVKLGLFEERAPADFLAALAPLESGHASLVLVMFADRDPELDLLPAVAGAGFAGVMLDTADKASGGLRGCLEHAWIERFVRDARALGLACGLAGALSEDDVAPLLSTAPDLLGFRTALCRGARRTGALDAAAVTRLRAAIPRTSGVRECLRLPAAVRRA